MEIRPPILEVESHSEVVASAAAPSQTVASVVHPVTSQTAATVVSPSPPASGPPTATRPVKAAKTSQADSGVNLVKKQLFQSPLQHQTSTIPASGLKKIIKSKRTTFGPNFSLYNVAFFTPLVLFWQIMYMYP